MLEVRIIRQRVSINKLSVYPMGRSFAQVKAHCESLLDKLEDSNFRSSDRRIKAEINKMIAEWN